MNNKVAIMLLLSVFLLLAGCSGNNALNTMGIEINSLTSSIGAVGENTNDFETQSFKYIMTLTNNDASDIKIVSVEPVLSQEFQDRVSDRDTVIHVNKTVIKGSSLDVSGEIVFDAKGLTKEQIISMEPFIKEIRIIEERIINKSF